MFWKDKVWGWFGFLGLFFFGVGGGRGEVGERREQFASVFLAGFGDLQISCTGEQQKPIKILWKKYNGPSTCYKTRDFRVHMGWNTHTSALNKLFGPQLSGHFLLHLTCSKEILYPKKPEQIKPVTKACQNLLVWDSSNLLCFFWVWQQQKHLKAEKCHNRFMPALPWPLHERSLHREAVSALGKTDVTAAHLYQAYCKFC